MKFNLDMFLALNEEYADKPLVARPPQYDRATLEDRSLKRAKSIATKYPVKGRRVLEIGCGRGETCFGLARHYGCEAVGVDIRTYDEWPDAPSGVQLIDADLSGNDAPDLGTFDTIYSNSVWEHLRHPYTMLRKAHELLRSDGRFILSANLYRGPKASHRYREVFFPWPHLLFTDRVFEEFYRGLGQKPKRPAWVNQLSIADYYRYFELIGFEIVTLKFSITKLDEGFYNRFEDVLSRFPRYDLERDFIHVTLKKKKSSSLRWHDLHAKARSIAARTIRR